MEFNEKIYSTTLKLILLKSISEILPEEEVQIQHTLGKGLYGELKNKISTEQISLVKKRMDEIIKNDLPINLVTSDIEDIRKKLKDIKRKDIVRTVNTTGWLPIKEYELDGYHDFFYEKTYSTTGNIYLYDLISYSDGFILRFPLSSNPKELPLYIETPKLSLTQRECGIWGEMMDVSYIGSLNEKTMNGTIEELIRVSETLHEVKLVKLTNKIIANKKIKLVTIAGPSSSGKTTFSKRLMLYLKANRVFPILISLDSYYVGREKVPLDEYGKKDFESIAALDLELLNKNIKDLIEGKKVEIPEYDFVTGKRKEHGTWMAIPKNGILIIEGIHGLNEELTRDIPRDEKFKIYISCLTQLNVDMHNRIPTNEVRKIRRIVRDSLSRGTKVEETLAMWDSVRRGEEKYIFKFQEEADVMFDSNLVYELGVLKKHAMKELIKIKIESEYYEEAKRLLRFLYCFVDIDDKYVPDMSLLKEFIGGSYFYNY